MNKLTERDPSTGKIKWTEFADELSREDISAIGELARRLIYEHERTAKS